MNNIGGPSNVSKSLGSQVPPKVAEPSDSSKLEELIIELLVDQKQENIPEVQSRKVVEEKKLPNLTPYHLTLTKVEKFVLKLLSKLSFIPHAHAHVKKHKAEQVKVAVGGSLNRAELHKNFQPYTMNPNLATQNLEISHTLLANPKNLEKALKDHTSVAREAVRNKAHEDVKPFETDIGKMLAYRFEIKGEVTPGQVTPTSYLLGKKEHADHLTNAYTIVVDGKDYAIIRSAKIDTLQKAEEFIQLLEHVHSQIAQTKGDEKYQMRVVSQQLNSFENESKIINAQHRWITHVNSSLSAKGFGEIVHINIPSNRWYNYTKALQKMGPIGAFFYKFTGERHSREQNLESLSSYVKWTLGDVYGQINRREIYKIKYEQYNKNLSELNELVEKANLKLEEKKLDPQLRKQLENQMKSWKQEIETINREKKERLGADYKTLSRMNNKEQCQKEIDTLVQKIYDTQAKINVEKPDRKAKAGMQSELKEWTQELKRARQEMKYYLIEDYKDIARLEADLRVAFKQDPTNDAYKTNLQKASLMRQFLGAQLNLPGASMDRGKEGMVIQLLNSHLGVTSAMNCKSGLDRTGLWHATKLAMESMEKTFGSDRTYRLVEDWEKTTMELNKLHAQIGQERLNAWLNGTQDDEIISLLGKNAGNMEELKEKMRDVIEFRKLVLNNLIRIGIPITITSTGLMGLKWNKGMTQNLIPLNFLPSTIDIVHHVHFNASQVEDTGKKGAPIVKYDPKTGQPQEITHYGSTLLTKLQSYRGS